MYPLEITRSDVPLSITVAFLVLNCSSLLWPILLQHIWHQCIGKKALTLTLTLTLVLVLIVTVMLILV